MNWIPLHCHTHLSLLDAISKPKEIAKRCSELGYSACAMTDHGNANGAIAFSKAMLDKNIKPILGIEAYIKLDQEKYSHQVILAKNLKGWKNLVKLISRSNDEDRFYSKPRIHVEDLELFSDNLISFSGHPGSTISDLLKNDKKLAIKYAEKMRDIFGKDNFFIEIQNLIPTQQSKEIISELRDIANITELKCIATADSHYVNRQDSRDQQVALCSLLQKTIKEAKASNHFNLFFNHDCFHIPSADEVYGTDEEKENTLMIAEMCEKYSLSSPPKLPKFIDGDENAYLRQLCREGWRKKSNGWGDEYVNRINYELKVIEEANLAGYFLIVQDYVNWAKNQGWLLGPGRGCFLPDTRVKIEYQLYTPISCIKIGDIIIDAFGNKQKVINTLEYEINEEIVELEFENNKTIRCTKDHKFLTKNRGWVEAQYLDENDDIVEV